MFAKKSVFRMFSVLLFVLMMSVTASARPLESALGTGFTYQGKLTDGGAPANGTYDLEFKLYDALSGGAQVGSTVTQDDVTVTNGLFTVQLDFGNVFDGTALYLEIGVRPGASVGTYTAIVPRQQLSATPYAIYASNAPWSGLSGVPAGFADGVDNDTTYTAGTGLTLTGTQFSVSSAYQLPQGCTNGNVAKWNGSAWSCATDSDTTAVGGDLSGSQTSATVTKLQGRAVASSAPASGQVLKYDGSQWVPGADSTTHYQNVVVVSKSGGDFTSISAALGSISDASASNPYLIFVAPGVYTEQVTMKPYVDIQGAGETATKITYPGNYDRGTVAGANNTELRFLTVESTAGFGSIAISNSGTAPRLTHITANASGLGGTDRVIGLYNIAGSAPILTNVSISATGPASTGDFDVWNINSSITMMNVTASASGSGEYNVGVVNEASQAIINNSTICSPVTGGGVSNFGIYNYMEGVSYIIQVNNSQISGVYPFYNVSGPIVHVAASQLNGGAVYGGTMICAGVYDENYTFFAGPACP